MLAIETHRGGQLSPLAAALASALSRGRVTVDHGVQVESGDVVVGGSQLPHSARPEALVCASEPHVLGLRACLVVSQMVEDMVAIPKIDFCGLLSGTEELQKAISMGLLDTAWLLGWEPEDTFPDDDEVLFSQRCRLYCARGSKWRQVAEGCGELRKNKFTRKVRFELRVESGFGWFAHFYAVRAPPFVFSCHSVLQAGNFTSSTVLWMIPQFNMLLWSLLRLSSPVSSKSHLKRQTG